MDSIPDTPSDLAGGSVRDQARFLAGGIEPGPLRFDGNAPQATFRAGWTLQSSTRFVAGQNNVQDVVSAPVPEMSNASAERETTGSASSDTRALELSSQNNTAMIHLASADSEDEALSPARVASAEDGFIPASLRSSLSSERFSASNRPGSARDGGKKNAAENNAAGNNAARSGDIDAATDSGWRAMLGGEVRMALKQDDVPLPPTKPKLTRLEICHAISEVAETQHLPAPFLVSLIWQESRFDENAVSPVGAQGIAQFMPQIAHSFGLDNPFEPLKALTASARMLRGLVDQFGNLGLAAAAYNGGSGRVENWLARKAKLPKETRTYVIRVTGRTPEHWKANRQKHVVTKSENASAPCPGMESFAEALNEKAREAIRVAKLEAEAKEEARKAEREAKKAEQDADEKAEKKSAKSKSRHRPKLHRVVVASNARDEDEDKSDNKGKARGNDKTAAKNKADGKGKSADKPKSRDKAKDKTRARSAEKADGKDQSASAKRVKSDSRRKASVADKSQSKHSRVAKGKRETRVASAN